MNLLVPTRRFDKHVLEMMDDPAADPAMLKGELTNLRKINRYFGGLSAIRKSLVSLLQGKRDASEIRILDLGTGSADLPIHLVENAKMFDRKFHITAVDNNPVVLEVARERTKSYAGITIERGDLLDLKYPPKAFDIVICSLTLHHFSNEDVLKILNSMRELSRIGFIVNDLKRSWPAAWTARLYCMATTRNPMSIADSYLSVLRGFTPDELRSMAHRSGIQTFEIRTHPFFRLLLIGRHG